MPSGTRGFVTASAVVFTLVTVVQSWRALSGWPVEINHYSMPLAASWAVAAFTGLLALWGWRSR